MNPTYAKLVKNKLDKLLHVGFIQHMKNPYWISPIVNVPMKNKEIRKYVDFRKLNTMQSLKHI